MNLKQLEKELRKRDKDVEVKIDSPMSFRIFIYYQKAKYQITAFIDRQKKFEIVKISDYPKQNNYPLCVVRVKRLRIMKKYHKRKISATKTLTKTNIKR